MLLCDESGSDRRLRRYLLKPPVSNEMVLNTCIPPSHSPHLGTKAKDLCVYHLHHFNESCFVVALASKNRSAHSDSLCTPWRQVVTSQPSLDSSWGWWFGCPRVLPWQISSELCPSCYPCQKRQPTPKTPGEFEGPEAFGGQHRHLLW